MNRCGIKTILRAVGFGAAIGAIGYYWGSSNADVQQIIRESPVQIWNSTELTAEQKAAFLTQGVNSLGLENRVDFVREQIEGLDEVSRYQVVDNALENSNTANLYRFTSKGLATLPQDQSFDLVTGYISRVDEDTRKSVIETGLAYCEDKTKRDIALAYSPSFGERVSDAWSGLRSRFERGSGDSGAPIASSGKGK